MPSLSRIVLNGYKSIAHCDLELTNLNVLIGPNGAGKSNLIQFFKMMQQLFAENLQNYITKCGGPDALLYFGRKNTRQIEIEMHMQENSYKCKLEPTDDDRLMLALEDWHTNYTNDFGGASRHSYRGPSGQLESVSETLKSCEQFHLKDIYRHTILPMKKWQVYHFHDTSASAFIKQRHRINDNMFLRDDASNLAAFFYLIKQTHPVHYSRIISTIRLAMPFFDDFYLRPMPENQDYIQLEWMEKGNDAPFKANLFSDGTLRFICLATALLQPEEYLPDTIIIDEPELGLHPFAISLLAAMLQSISTSKQVIIATQSVELLNEFEPEDIVVVDRTKDGSSFTRQSSEKLKEWLEEYSLGELWEKNVIGGGPFA